MTKAFLKVFILLPAICTLLVSCEDDGTGSVPGGLTIEAIAERSDNNVYTGIVGDTVFTAVNVSAPLGFLELVVTKIDADDTEEELERKVRANIDQMNVEEVFQYIIREEDANQEFTIRFRAYDVSDAFNDALITIIIQN